MEILTKINEAANTIKKFLPPTPIEFHEGLSKKYGANIYLKREDLQYYNSPMIRGVFNATYNHSLNDKKMLVCYENHSNYKEILISCCLIRRDITFFVTYGSAIKIRKQVFKMKEESFCYDIENFIKYVLIEDNERSPLAEATDYALKHNYFLITESFNSSQLILGQSLIGLELTNELNHEIDYVFAPINTGLTAASLCLFFKQENTQTKIIGIKTERPSIVKTGINNNENVLKKMEENAEFSANIYEIYFSLIDGIIFDENNKSKTSEGTFITDDIYFDLLLHNSQTIKSLNTYKDEIKGKNIVCLVNSLFE
jgi:threonine dehydratase